jgi:hypothetical protein
LAVFCLFYYIYILYTSIFIQLVLWFFCLDRRRRLSCREF